MNLKELVIELINKEDDLESKFDILTAVGVATTNQSLFVACEDVRNELPDFGKEKVGPNNRVENIQEQDLYSEDSKKIGHGDVYKIFEYSTGEQATLHENEKDGSIGQERI
jgi:hypothetical protein